MSKKENNKDELLPINELGVEQLRFYCEEECLDFQTTATVPPLEGIIGQERAVKAMDFGLHTKNTGNHIFVSGIIGTGKLTYAKQSVRKLAKGRPVPQDWCYVNNFEDSSQPIVLSLPAGTGSVFRQDMKELLENLRNEIPKAFNSEDYELDRTAIMKAFQKNRGDMQEAFEEKAKTFYVRVKWSTTGYMLMPLLDGKPVSEEESEKLNEEEKEKIKANLQAVHDLAMTEARKCSTWSGK